MNSFTSPLALTPQPLCDNKGRLQHAAIGLSPRPQVDCALHGHAGRRKRWNHWCITSPQWTLSLTLADLDYASYGAAYFLDMESGEAAAHTLVRPLGMSCHLPDSPLHSHAFLHPRLQLRVDEHPGRLRLTAAVPDIGGQPLQVALDIQRPAHLESLNIVAPLTHKGFHACSRQIGMPAAGSLQLGRHHYDCTLGQSFAALDFGRGVWPFHSYWQRAAFAAPGGIAGNFGSGWLEHSGLSENTLWFGGALSPLNSPLHIEPAPLTMLAPRRLRSNDERVALTFTPRQLHRARPKFGPFYADTRQWFGRYDGVLRGPKGERVPVDGALGWLGETHTRW
ncbi:conserved hypothetical protein [Pseudomonas sp. 8Z]|uniref:DUF2804 domain-containing protein n=1 Tax=Pseudomonas sp. 8Z TaxID=2653166 RepID=UPI0012EF36EE|nr:DUF2804 domain-containing protein [Pseudomonas sp. 8Z]VXC42080.1 conserved hypothetical protein [Pseudomonas sp. 8Z]